MGNFLSFAAFRHDDPAAVAGAIVQVVDGHGGRAALGAAGDGALVHAADGGWVVVAWEPTTPYLKLTLDTGAVLDCPWVMTDVYDSDFWRFAAGDGGRLAGRFHSDPSYFDEGDPRWEAPDATAVAAVLGADPGSIAPYFEAGPEAEGQAFEDDEFELDDEWVFTDLWQRLGITYPESEDSVAATVALVDTMPVQALGEP